MKNILFFVVLICSAFSIKASAPDSTVSNDRVSVLVIPYNPAMHLSDADQDISEGSQMAIPEMRSKFRTGLVKALNKNFTDVYDVRGMENNAFVKEDNRETEVLYHTLLYETDSVYTLKNPTRYAVKDTSQNKKAKGRFKPEATYINVGIYDDMLIPDLSKKYNADYIIFLNEFDIKTNFDDCMNLALKIYRRDLKVHYSIFDRSGKQVYGDVAVSHFDSNTNDVNEIAAKNFPAISNYILNSLEKVSK